MQLETERPAGGWRQRLFDIIFLSDTPSGKAFDVTLILLILASLLVVMLESVEGIREVHGALLGTLETILTALFTLEYVLWLACVRRPTSYARSFFGLVDLFAILPWYLTLVFPAARYFLVIRALRILRIFRVLKLANYLDESAILARALYASRHKIVVFLYTVSTVVCILGSLMYVIEGPEYGFTSIPRAIYWAVVTLTTVGYGDISPQSPWGQAIATVIMIMGYGIIAVPTGVITVELNEARRAEREQGQRGPSPVDGDARSSVERPPEVVVAPGTVLPGSFGTTARTPESAPRAGLGCEACGAAEHAADARFCRCCGAHL